MQAIDLNLDHFGLCIQDCIQLLGALPRPKNAKLNAI